MEAGRAPLLTRRQLADGHTWWAFDCSQVPSNDVQVLPGRDLGDETWEIRCSFGILPSPIRLSHSLELPPNMSRFLFSFAEQGCLGAEPCTATAAAANV